MSPPNTAAQRITDLNLAAFLLALGYRLLDVEPGARVTFLFDAPDTTVLAFYAEDTLVPARKLLDALKNLKGITQGGRR